MRQTRAAYSNRTRSSGPQRMAPCQSFAGFPGSMICRVISAQYVGNGPAPCRVENARVIPRIVVSRMPCSSISSSAWYGVTVLQVVWG